MPATLGCARNEEKQRSRGDLPFPIVSVEIRHLRAFLAAAEELNFTRAAARIPVAQQALSAQIAQLEALVGTRLFDRTTRRVALTPAGHAFHERARDLLAQLDDAVEAARLAGEGQVGRLLIGLLGTSTLDVTPRILRAFAAEHPDVAVSVQNVAFSDPTGGVRDGDSDVAIVWLPFDTRGLVVEPLLEDRRVALLPHNHPLAAREELRVEDLVDEPFGWIDGLDEVALGFWTLGSHRGGRPARVGARITGFEDYLAAVRAGQAVACSPASIARSLFYEDVAVRPVVDAEPAQVALCRRADDEGPLVSAFFRVARSVVAA
jgi:DNA-binding transcriptional LysR family regulator